MNIVAVVATIFATDAKRLAAGELRGLVTHVRDGDTIVVNRQPIRLNGIHAPELSERGGVQASDFVRVLVKGKRVRCQLNGERSFDRLIAICFLGERDIARELIAAGLARDCGRYSGGRYLAAETEASMRLPLPSYCR